MRAGFGFVPRCHVLAPGVGAATCPVSGHGQVAASTQAGLSAGVSARSLPSLGRAGVATGRPAVTLTPGRGGHPALRSAHPDVVASTSRAFPPWGCRVTRHLIPLTVLVLVAGIAGCQPASAVAPPGSRSATARPTSPGPPLVVPPKVRSAPSPAAVVLASLTVKGRAARISYSRPGFLPRPSMLTSPLSAQQRFRRAPGPCNQLNAPRRPVAQDDVR